MSKKKKSDKEFVPEVIEAHDGEGFFGFIPQQIEAHWDEKWGPLLEGFPLNVLYGRIKEDAQNGNQSVAEACYWPDLAAFREDSERKEICYFTKPVNAYFVRVIFEKKTGYWKTEKYKGNELIRSAFGATFDGAMIHTTMGGPEPDEYLPVRLRRHGRPGRRVE